MLADWYAQKTLEKSVPSLAVPELRYSSAPATAQSTTVRTLRQLLDKLDDLKAGRTTIVESAKRTAQFDDIKPQIIREAARLGEGKEGGGGTVGVEMFEGVFESELAKHKKFREGIKESSARQEDLLDQIRVSPASPLSSRFALTRGVLDDERIFPSSSQNGSESTETGSSITATRQGVLHVQRDRPKSHRRTRILFEFLYAAQRVAQRYQIGTSSFCTFSNLLLMLHRDASGARRESSKRMIKFRRFQTQCSKLLWVVSGREEGIRGREALTIPREMGQFVLDDAIYFLYCN